MYCECELFQRVTAEFDENLKWITTCNKCGNENRMDEVRGFGELLFKLNDNLSKFLDKSNIKLFKKDNAEYKKSLIKYLMGLGSIK